MDKESKNKAPLSFYKRPWFIESVVFFLVLWQESFRLSARTSHKILPVPSILQNYYYYNFGDFVNGYIMAFIADGIINLTLLNKGRSFKIVHLEITTRSSAVLATLFSTCVVVVYELTQSTTTTSDANDIPAGILGALFYYLIRQFALKRSSHYHKQIK